MWPDDLPLAVLAGLLGAALCGLAWVAVAPDAPVARGIRALCGRLGGVTRVAVSLIALLTFLLVANEVMDGARSDPGEFLAQLDQGVRAEVRTSAARPILRAVGKAVGRASGVGLALVTGLVTAGLAWAGRRREALVILAGTGTAWLLAQLLKLWFRVPRPGVGARDYAITGLGFPSAHALVTVVALGLFAWALGRTLGPRGRVALHAAVVVATLVTAFSRVALTVHWTSDVVAGLAIGTVWLNLVVASQTWRGDVAR